MKKWAIIAIFYTLPMAILVLIAHSPILSEHSEGRYLAFDRERWRYKVTSPLEEHSIVLIGPSFVNRLKAFNGNIHNLGLPAMCPAEIQHVIGASSKRDESIYYGVNLWNAFALNWPARKVAYSTVARHKGAIKSLFFGSLDKKDAAFREAVEEAIPSVAGNLKERDIRDSVAFLHELHKKYPNMRFILFPTQPTTETARNVELFRSYLLEYDLPVIDLSDAVPDDQFSDLLHPSPEGYEILKARITEAVSSSQRMVKESHAKLQ